MMIDKSDLLLLKSDDGGGEFDKEVLDFGDCFFEVGSLFVGQEVFFSLVLLKEDIDSFFLLNLVDLVLDDTWLFP